MAVRKKGKSAFDNIYVKAGGVTVGLIVLYSLFNKSTAATVFSNKPPSIGKPSTPKPRFDQQGNVILYKNGEQGSCSFGFITFNGACMSRLDYMAMKDSIRINRNIQQDQILKKNPVFNPPSDAGMMFNGAMSGYKKGGFVGAVIGAAVGGIGGGIKEMSDAKKYVDQSTVIKTLENGNTLNVGPDGLQFIHGPRTEPSRSDANVTKEQYEASKNYTPTTPIVLNPNSGRGTTYGTNRPSR